MENNIALDVLYKYALNMLATFDKDYLSRIRTGNTDNYGEHAQSQLYQKLMSQFANSSVDINLLIADVKIYARQINSQRQLETKHSDWEINPNIISRLDKVVEFCKELDSNHQM